MPYKDIIKQKQAQHESYLRNKEKTRKKVQSLRANHREWYNALMKDKCCTYCPENCIPCLDWHHLDPSTKNENISKMMNSCRTFNTILEEMNKCIVVCSNCHRKIHAGLI